MKVTVVGSGGWGTALSIVLRDNGHSVTLWSHDPEKAERMRSERENPLLPGILLPPEIAVTNDTAGLREAEMVVFATPSFAMRETARTLSACISQDTLLVSVTKGIESGSHLRMSQILRAETGQRRVAVLSGPSHAEEVSRRLPTGCVAASEDRKDAETVQRAFMNDAFRIYISDDVQGVEIAAALKNIVALCCGISDGLGYGDNSKAMIITRSLFETTRLTEKLGGRRDTLAGLSGIGDLIVTCTSMHSRNRRAGIRIGQGEDAEQVIRGFGAVVEGYYASKSAKELADALQIEMPICQAVYSVLFEKADVREIAKALMCRKPKTENEFCFQYS